MKGNGEKTSLRLYSYILIRKNAYLHLAGNLAESVTYLLKYNTKLQVLFFYPRTRVVLSKLSCNTI